MLEVSRMYSTRGN